jgi:hypothetical protein
VGEQELMHPYLAGTVTRSHVAGLLSMMRAGAHARWGGTHLAVCRCVSVPHDGAEAAHFFAALDFFGAGAAAAFFAIAKGINWQK